MSEFDADGHEDEDEDQDQDEVVFPVVGVDFVLREARARAQAQLLAPAGGPAVVVGRLLAWLRGVWWRVDPRLLYGMLQVRFRVWLERVDVDWPRIRRGLFAVAGCFLFMVLLVLRQEGHHLLPRLTTPFELPRDSYLRRLQRSVRVGMIMFFRLLCVMRGTSAVIDVLVGLRIDVGGWQFFNDLFQEVEADQDHELVVIRGRIRWAPLLALMLLIVTALFLFDPTTDQEPPRT